MACSGGGPPHITVSGHRSAPFGQTTVPCSTLTCLKRFSSTLRGSKIGPTIRLERSRSMTDPSVSVSRNFHLSSGVACRILRSAMMSTCSIPEEQWVLATAQPLQDSNPVATLHGGGPPIPRSKPMRGVEVHHDRLPTSPPRLMPQTPHSSHENEPVHDHCIKIRPKNRLISGTLRLYHSHAFL